NMAIYGEFQPPAEIELSVTKATLKDLLGALSKLCPSVEFTRGNELGSDIKTVLVNNKEQIHLDARLSDGNRVMVVVEMAPLGGG
ncbi:hypothetical protein ACFLYF_06375, partial [Chloroflexota bacterium]